ncbi:MAG: cyanophycinase [Methanobacteriota archaeon]|nr:MAG: cyanophycinase [Euryarchaeota archaeon]
MADVTTYLAIGGAMELTPENPLVDAFIKGSGGEDSVITILPTASDYANEVGPLYESLFSKLSNDVEYYVIDRRDHTENPRLIDRIDRSTGIFFTGGNQLRITSLLGGSPLMQAINRARSRGVFIAGTSAGASAMSSTMIAGGKSDVMFKGSVDLSPGLGFISNAVIDSHFIKRGRITRLLNVVSLNPGTIGLGLSENTGILFKEGQSMIQVMGSRQIIVVDGSSISHTNIASLPDNKPFSVTDVRIHVLGNHYGFDIKTRELFIPTKEMMADSPDFDPQVGDLPFVPVKLLEGRDW